MSLGYESDIERLLCKEVEKLGGRCVKWGVNGEPDRIVLLPGGLTVFVETKRADGKLSRLQDEKIRRLKRLGYLVFVPYTKEGVKTIIGVLKMLLEDEDEARMYRRVEIGGVQSEQDRC